MRWAFCRHTLMTLRLRAGKGGHEVTISEIELTYRLQPLPDAQEDNAQIELETRPAWRFASSTNRNMDNVFVLFIDAITGEVLP